RDEQVELAVIVVIDPGGAGAKARAGHAHFCRDISEFTVVEIVKKMSIADGRNVDVIIAVVVIVADRATQAIHLSSESGLSGHIGEGAVLVVVIKRGIRLAGFVS